jgi:GAF domain-containing protein
VTTAGGPNGPDRAPRVAAGDPVLGAVIQAATRATGATAGWVVASRDADLLVVAADGDGTQAILGRAVPSGAGVAGFVVASGQPLALAGGSDARLTEGVAALLGRQPRAVVCVPCTAADDTVVGALELIDKATEARFTFDDVELVTLLAGIAATALAHGAAVRTVPGPTELAGELRRLAATDADRYAAVATVLQALLAE